MRFNRPSNVFPHSVIPSDLVDMYGVLANRVVDDVLQHYVYFKSDGRRNSIVDEMQWKLCKASKDFAVYKQRYIAKEHCNVLQSLDGEDLVISKNKCPMLVGIGSVDGRLDDMLYGAVVENTRDLRIRVAYTEEDVEDAQVLQVLTTPTADNPFSSGSVIWVVNRASSIPFIKKRDLIQLHFVGTRILANGERVGFSMWHSIETRKTPSLYNSMDLVRAKSSSCVIWRQATENTIDVYHRGFVAYMGNAPEFASTTVGVQAILAARNIIHAAYAKKFFRYIEKLPHYRNRGRTSSSQSLPTQCSGGCAGNVTLTFGVCIVCRKPVCQQCKFLKRIIFDIRSESGVSQKWLSACNSCVSSIRRTDAYPLAIQDSIKRNLLTASQTASTEVCA